MQGPIFILHGLTALARFKEARNQFDFEGIPFDMRSATKLRLLVHVQHSNGLKSERCLIFPERRDVMLPSTRRETMKVKGLPSRR